MVRAAGAAVITPEQIAELRKLNDEMEAAFDSARPTESDSLWCAAELLRDKFLEKAVVILPALLDEVERLRAALAAERAATEREICEWLKAKQQDGGAELSISDSLYVAGCIERGEYRKEKP